MIMVVIVGGLVLNAFLTEGEITENEVAHVEPVVEPDCLSVVGNERACEAAYAVIRKEELEAEESRLEGEIEALRAELDAIKIELSSF